MPAYRFVTVWRLRAPIDDVYAAIDRAGGALPVADGERLTRSLADLLPDTGLQREMARAAADAVNALGGAVERTMRALGPFVVQALARP